MYVSLSLSSEKLGLNLINDLKSKYNCSVGFSDHSGNALTPILAKLMV